MSSTSSGRARARTDQPPTPTPDVEPAAAPAPRWWRFSGPYPVVPMPLGREVAPGEVVEWPEGPPDTAHWSPASQPAPTDTAPTDTAGGAGTEESR